MVASAEAPVAVRALEGLLSGVLARVPGQLVRPGKGTAKNRIAEDKISFGYFKFRSANRSNEGTTQCGKTTY